MKTPAEMSRASTDRHSISESVVRVLFSRIADGALLVADDGTIEWFNSPAQKLFSSRADELHGKTIFELLPESFRDAQSGPDATPSLAALLSAGGSDETSPLFRRSNRELSLDVTFAEVQGDHGKKLLALLGQAAVAGEPRVSLNQRVLNEAAARLAEQAGVLRQERAGLQQLQESTRSLSLMRSHFLSNLSHEVRTPLTAILGYADLLLEDARGHSCREELLIVRQNGEQLLGLFNDVLDLSQAEAGLLKLRPVSVSPALMCREVVAQLQPLAEERGLQLTLEIGGNISEKIWCDALRVRQVLWNLLSNGLKYTERGEVRLLVNASSGANKPTAGIRFEVVDSGVGIASESLPRLFEPFSQLSAAATRPFGGSGVGLALCQKLARMMGGEITVESSPGKGSRFSFLLDVAAQPERSRPSAASEAPEPPKLSPEPASRLQGARILIAEDVPATQKLIDYTIRKAGARTTLVQDGAAALKAVSQSTALGVPIQLIVLDMQMPIMDGYEAARRLRQSGCQTPIIALTANAMVGDRERCLEAGCNAYISKPIDNQELLAAVESWLAAGDAAKKSSR